MKYGIFVIFLFATKNKLQDRCLNGAKANRIQTVTDALYVARPQISNQVMALKVCRFNVCLKNSNVS